MTGNVKLIGDTAYLETNSDGTLEKLPRLHWARQLQLFLLNRFGQVETIGEVRDFLEKHGYPRE